MGFVYRRQPPQVLRQLVLGDGPKVTDFFNDFLFFLPCFAKTVGSMKTSRTQPSNKITRLNFIGNLDLLAWGCEMRPISFQVGGTANCVKNKNRLNWIKAFLVCLVDTTENNFTHHFSHLCIAHQNVDDILRAEIQIAESYQTSIYPSNSILLSFLVIIVIPVRPKIESISLMTIFTKFPVLCKRFVSQISCWRLFWESHSYLHFSNFVAFIDHHVERFRFFIPSFWKCFYL